MYMSYDIHRNILFADFKGFHVPEISELNAAVTEIQYLWEDVGLGLGLTAGQLRTIKTNTAGHVRQAQKCFTEVFISWRDGRTSTYAWEKLVSVLLQPDIRNDTKDHVFKLYKTLSAKYPSIR